MSIQPEEYWDEDVSGEWGVRVNYPDTEELMRRAAEEAGEDADIVDVLRAMSRILAHIDRAREVVARDCEARGLKFEDLLRMTALARRRLEFDGRLSASPTAGRVCTKLHRHGYTFTQIAAMLNVSVEAVELYAKEKRYPVTGRVAEVVALHRKGLTPIEISKETGIASGTIYRIYADAGIEVPNRKLRKMTPEMRQRILEALRRKRRMGEKGKNYRYIDIAREVGCTPADVGNVKYQAVQRGELRK